LLLGSCYSRSRGLATLATMSRNRGNLVKLLIML